MHRVKELPVWERWDSHDALSTVFAAKQGCQLHMQVEMSTRSTNRSFKKLITERDDVTPSDIYQALCSQNVELVFTAHPTQVHQS